LDHVGINRKNFTRWRGLEWDELGWLDRMDGLDLLDVLGLLATARGKRDASKAPATAHLNSRIRRAGGIGFSISIQHPTSSGGINI